MGYPPPDPNWGYYHQPQHYVPAVPPGVPRCACCGYVGHMAVQERISSGGWIVFALLMLFCFPLFWIPLIAMKDRARQCPVCLTIQGGGYG